MRALRVCVTTGFRADRWNGIVEIQPRKGRQVKARHGSAGEKWQDGTTPTGTTRVLTVTSPGGTTDNSPTFLARAVSPRVTA
jgi:hypothetical protein